MLGIVKIGGLWQIWNITCDGSIIVENVHRNMAFFKRPLGKKTRVLVNSLKPIKPVFSLSKDFSRVVLDSDLEQDPSGLHVFDYEQLYDAGIDIKAYLEVIDFRLGSFVVYAGKIFTAERVADELDDYPGRPFIIRHLEGRRPAPIEPADIFDISVPPREDARTKLLEGFEESLGDEYTQIDPHELEGEIEDYIDTYCYPDLDLKIPSARCGR